MLVDRVRRLHYLHSEERVEVPYTEVRVWHSPESVTLTMEGVGYLQRGGGGLWLQYLWRGVGRTQYQQQHTVA